MAEAFDTLKASKDLQASGIAPEHSESIAEVINGAILGNVASKHDADLIRRDIEALKDDVSTLKDDVTTLKGDVSTLKDDVRDLKSDVKVVDAKIDGLKQYMLYRMILLQLGGIGILFTLIKFFG